MCLVTTVETSGGSGTCPQQVPTGTAFRAAQVEGSERRLHPVPLGTEVPARRAALPTTVRQGEWDMERTAKETGLEQAWWVSWVSQPGSSWTGTKTRIPGFSSPLLWSCCGERLRGCGDHPRRLAQGSPGQGG